MEQYHGWQNPWGCLTAYLEAESTHPTNCSLLHCHMFPIQRENNKTTGNGVINHAWGPVQAAGLVVLKVAKQCNNCILFGVFCQNDAPKGS